MKITLYSVQSERIVELAGEVAAAEWAARAFWVEIRCDDRSAAGALLEQATPAHWSEIRDHVLRPADHPMPGIGGGFAVHNLPIVGAAPSAEPDHMSFIFLPELVVTILPESSSLHLDSRSIPSSEHLFEDPRFALLRELLFEVVTADIQYLMAARERVNRMNLALTETPEVLGPHEVMGVHTDVGRLADTFEDQHVGVQVLSSLLAGTETHRDVEQLRESLAAFRELSRLVARLEEKAESLRFHFLLIHQELATRKINVLTIVQAIFVPLTFLAGVYGMNFVHMPELALPWAYPAIWALFVVIAGTLLAFFKKNGWFD